MMDLNEELEEESTLKEEEMEVDATADPYTAEEPADENQNAAGTDSFERKDFGVEEAETESSGAKYSDSENTGAEDFDEKDFETEKSEMEAFATEDTEPEDTGTEDSEPEVSEEDSSEPRLVEISNDENAHAVVKTYMFYPGEKKKKKRLKWILSLIAGLLLVAAVVIFAVYENNLVYKVVHVEAGVEVQLADLLMRPDEKAYFTEDSEAFDMKVPGEYHLKIHTGGLSHPCSLIVEDTIAPEVKAKPVVIDYGLTCEPEDFIEKIEDVTATKVRFVNEPDYTDLEEQKIELAVTDLGGNTTKAETTLRISLVLTHVEIEAGTYGSYAAKEQVDDEEDEEADSDSDAADLKTLTVSDFLVPSAVKADEENGASNFNTEDAEILTDLSEVNFSKVETYEVTIQVNGKEYESELAIVDTIPPVFSVKNIEGFAFVKRQAGDFVTDSEDATEVTYTFETQPDLKKFGKQSVTIIGTDEGGNTSSQTATLTLNEDTEDPTITGSDFVVYLGDKISYKSKVSVHDNCPEDLTVTVDSSAVATGQIGTYPVTYTVKDAAGHTATLTLNVTIKEHTYDLAELNDTADRILAGIINDNMSQYDKAWAIFSYIRGHVGYVSTSEKGDWVKAAYQGINKGSGDCYVYACVSKLLLTRAGITNMDIQRIPSGNSMHYWNLVDIGDGHGWYHFDTTPRVDHPTIFLWTESQIKAYSDTHNNCHNYDRSLYPTVY